MSTLPAPLSKGRANLVLATLFLGMFVLGSAELLVVGVLNLTALAIRLDKRLVLVGALVLFVVANVVAVLTTDYGLFLAARVGAGAFQGLFIAGAFVAGTAVVPPERRGRAMSVVFSGVAVSAALGVPLGTLVGQALGWRGSFVAIVVLSVIALIAALVVVPSVPSTGGGAGDQARHAFAPRVLAVLLLAVLVFGAVYAALTYIVPFLESVTGVSGALVSAFLLAYGVATAIGSFAGGRFADDDAARTLVVGATGAVAALLTLYLAGAVAFLVMLGLAALGLFVGGMAPSLQYRVVSLAGPGGSLAQSLPASAANVGVAVGSIAGGRAIETFTTSAAVLTGLVVAVIAAVVAWATGFLRSPMVEETVNAL